MNTAQLLENRIINVTPSAFSDLALDIFRFQFENNPVYQQYCSYLNIQPKDVNNFYDIPFLPVSLFKHNDVKTTSFETDLIFESSGTTDTISSKHHVKKPELYKAGLLKTFEQFYGSPADYSFLALLPSYLERGSSSLVYMVNELMQHTKHTSDFYLHNHNELYERLLENEKLGQKTLLIGVTYALLDFADAYKMNLKHTIVMETGGMKGRKKEITRDEVHQCLIQNLGLQKVHSEYGMTELLSQAYSEGDGIFVCPPAMKILARNEEDPFEIYSDNKTRKGVANIIDLFNLYSCSFIAVDDLITIYPNNSFSVSGRLDLAELRGCSLLSLDTIS